MIRIVTNFQGYVGKVLTLLKASLIKVGSRTFFGSFTKKLFFYIKAKKYNYDMCHVIPCPLKESKKLNGSLFHFIRILANFTCYMCIWLKASFFKRGAWDCFWKVYKESIFPLKKQKVLLLWVPYLPKASKNWMVHNIHLIRIIINFHGYVGKLLVWLKASLIKRGV